MICTVSETHFETRLRILRQFEGLLHKLDQIMAHTRMATEKSRGKENSMTIKLVIEI